MGSNDQGPARCADRGKATTRARARAACACHRLAHPIIPKSITKVWNRRSLYFCPLKSCQATANGGEWKGVVVPWRAQAGSHHAAARQEQLDTRVSCLQGGVEGTRFSQNACISSSQHGCLRHVCAMC